MYSISEELVVLLIMVGALLVVSAILSFAYFIFVNRSNGILKGRIKRRDEEIEELKTKNVSTSALLVVRTQEKEFFEKSASTDFLTGLHNKPNLMHRLNQEISRISRGNKYSLLIFFDLNKFKAINDKYGHGVGDLVLKKIAKILKLKLRTQDILFRLGGDEFVIIMPGVTLEKGAVVARRLIRYFKSVVLEDYPEVNVTPSIGITDICNQTVDEIIERSDRAMYIAKNSDPEREGSFFIISSKEADEKK